MAMDEDEGRIILDVGGGAGVGEGKIEVFARDGHFLELGVVVRHCGTMAVFLGFSSRWVRAIDGRALLTCAFISAQ
jgi:hypothetical protein